MFSFVAAVLTCLSIVSAQRCGCSECTNTVLNTYAGDYTCGARIAFLESRGKTEEEACSRVAGTEFPSICGPSCDPALCDGRMNDPGPQMHCGCLSCTNEKWNTVTDVYTCGARISYLTDTLGYSTRNACSLVAGDQFPSICGPFCDPDLCEAIPEPTVVPTLAPTLGPTLEPTTEPTTKQPTLAPTMEPTTKQPTMEPTTKQPTTEPTLDPTTLKPTGIPSLRPTPIPTREPSPLPTFEVLASNTPTVSAPTSSPDGPSSPTEPAEHCGCYDCTEAVWNTIADIHTCGARIIYVTGDDVDTYSTEEDACRLVAGAQFPDVCGPACDPDSCDGRSPSSPGSEPTSTPNDNNSEPTLPLERCGCADCTEEIWNTLAAGYTCGARIDYVAGETSKYPTQEDACRQVASVEFPSVCGPGCNPDRCDGRIPSVVTTPPLTPESSLYCFPEYEQRTRYENMWGKYTVEVKEGTSCGPGSNDFTTNTVSVDNDELKLHFKKGANSWEGSEARVVLPEEEMPYTYGTYSFSVKTVSVLDADKAVIDTVLPQSLVLGLFTWDDTEIYAIHENWNHEVDVEISRWNIPGDPDTQFLVQPPEDPQFVRFYSGTGSTYDQGGHIYEFTWNPGKVTWYTDAAGGKDHSYATEDAIFAGLNDYVQCLPADVEVRMNLWNIFGSAMPVGMSDNQVVEVVIDDFSFTPSNLEYVVDGGYCTKACHCDPSSMCVNDICLPDF
jgi:hypothetical protein